MTNEEYIKLRDALATIEAAGTADIKGTVRWGRYQKAVDELKTFIHKTYREERIDNRG
jgi:ribosomal protein L31E